MPIKLESALDNQSDDRFKVARIAWDQQLFFCEDVFKDRFDQFDLRGPSSIDCWSADASPPGNCRNRGCFEAIFDERFADRSTNGSVDRWVARTPRTPARTLVRLARLQCRS